MESFIDHVFKLDEFIWDNRDITRGLSTERWVELANSQIMEITEASSAHEGAEWSDLFLVVLHRLRCLYGEYWPEAVRTRLHSHVQKGIENIKGKYNWYE